MILSLLAWSVFGLIIGVIAKYLTPGEEPSGWLVTMGIGILGSYFGGFIKWMAFGGKEISPSGILLSIVGAVLFLILWKNFSK
jgi:uncharacterized membrane protein YeaQ/YmgE (transglycosylase-associated protein family)